MKFTIKKGNMLIVLPPGDETHIYSYLDEEIPLYALFLYFINYPLSQLDIEKNQNKMSLTEKCLHELILGYFELPVSELQIKMIKDIKNTKVSYKIIVFSEHVEETLKQYNKNEIESATVEEIQGGEKRDFVFSQLLQLQKRIDYFTEACFIKKKFHPNFGGIDLEGIKYSIFFSTKFGEYGEAYEIDTIEAFCLFAMIKLLKREVTINKCQNCGDYFVPLTKSNEVYCNKVISNGRTCKNVGYENKINNDEILREYRKACKNKNAKKQRTKNCNPNAEKDYKKWTYEAKTKLGECQDGILTIDEFKEWLHKK